MSAALRLASAVALALPAAGFAQIQVDDRPKTLDPGPLTKDELNRRKAEEMLRDARAWYGVAIIAHRHEKLVEAATTLEKAAALDPDSLEIRRALVPLYIAIGREDDAMTLCRQVLDKDPHDPETGFQFAQLLQADGRPAEAIPVLERAVASKQAQDRPERLLHMLADLSDLLERGGDFAGAAKAHDAIVRTITEKHEQLLYGNGITREVLQTTLAQAYEHAGRARVKTKEYDRAVTAFRSARDTLLKSPEPEARHQAVRINWNLSEILAAQGKEAQALEALDAYLEHSPPEIEPYEKKVELLRKLGRDRDVVPALRRYVAHEEFNIRLQLLLAQELGKEPRTRPEAERTYLRLLKEHVKPEIYRGLFRLYQADARVGEAIDLVDDAVRVVGAKENEVKPDQRETALERYRAMLAALRGDSPVVNAFLVEASAELNRGKARQVETWSVLAYLAARAHKLDRAEQLFRGCLVNLRPDQELKVYIGLLEVLRLQRKHEEIVKLCRLGLARRGPRPGLEFLLYPPLASSLASLGRFDEALTSADKAIEQSSDERRVSMQNLKAEILAQAGRYDEAVRQCEETLKKFTQATEVQKVRYTLSNIYSLKGDHAKSEEQLRLVLETDPDAPLANNNLGYQMADRNVNLDEAERLIRRAIEADRAARKDVEDEGEKAAYLDSLGWVLFRRGKLAEAREWLEKTVTLPDGADDPAVWDHLGDVYAKLDLPAKASEAWQTAIKLFKDDPRKTSAAKRAEVEKKLKSLE
jgi:tetratricopeptide (TPR) repeat protein